MIIHKALLAFGLLILIDAPSSYARTVHYELRNTQDLTTYLIRVDRLDQRETPPDVPYPEGIYLRTIYDDVYKNKKLGFQRIQIWEDIYLVPTNTDDVDVYTKLVAVDIYRGRSQIAHNPGPNEWHRQTSNKDFYVKIWQYSQSLKK